MAIKYFKYQQKKSDLEIFEIFSVVSSLENYAKTVYSEEVVSSVLNDAFHHLIEHYNPQKGVLSHYAKSVVKKIGLTGNKKEVANSDLTDTNLDLDSFEGYRDFYTDEDITEESKNIMDCVRDIAFHFIKDYSFFNSIECINLGSVLDTKLKVSRKCDYSDLLSRYSINTLIEAKDYLLKHYSSEVESLLGLSKSSSIRNLGGDRYKKSLETSLEYIDIINGILLVRTKKGSRSRLVYNLDIRKTIKTILNLFYSSSKYGRIDIEGVVVYISLSGKIVNSVDELIGCIEDELIGSLLARNSSFKVLSYVRGKEIIFTNTKELGYDITLPLFDRDFVLELDNIVTKEV